MREVDAELIARARVVVDQRDAILDEAGDIVGAIQDGVVDESVMHAEIGEILLQQKQGRRDTEEITFFKSVGNAAQDLAVASRVLEIAEREDLGVIVDMGS